MVGSGVLSRTEGPQNDTRGEPLALGRENPDFRRARMNNPGLKEQFLQKAQVLSSITASVSTPAKALAYAVDVCERKEACQLMVSGCELPLSDSGQALCDQKQQKVLAAPEFSSEELAELSRLCDEKGMACIASGMRHRLAGIDVGLCRALWGIAETGTCVVESSSEEVRLATSVCETVVILLPVSRIVPRGEDISGEMTARMKNPPCNLAFITGPSRTADIERVLTIGVHGPLEAHIVLLED